MRTKDDWAEIYRKASIGHILWDGDAKNPYDPKLAYETSHRDINYASQLGFFNPFTSTLDIGCGNGRAAIALSEKLIYYTGIDVMKPCIDFCQETFSPYKHFNFIHMNIWNEDSNPNGEIMPINFSLPFADDTFDNVIVYSVFTHLQKIEIAARYMMEIKRVLKKGGLFLSTWYRSPPNPSVDFKTGRTVYYEHDIMTVLSGFYCLHTYGGHTDKFYDQWVIFSQKSL